MNSACWVWVVVIRACAGCFVAVFDICGLGGGRGGGGLIRGFSGSLFARSPLVAATVAMDIFFLFSFRFFHSISNIHRDLPSCYPNRRYRTPPVHLAGFLTSGLFYAWALIKKPPSSSFNFTGGSGYQLALIFL